jgi:hypothetical protein
MMVKLLEVDGGPGVAPGWRLAVEELVRRAIATGYIGVRK